MNDTDHAQSDPRRTRAVGTPLHESLTGVLHRVSKYFDSFGIGGKFFGGIGGFCKSYVYVRQIPQLTSRRRESSFRLYSCM